MMSCKELARFVSSEEYQSASPMKKIEVKFHQLICKYCAWYAKNIENLKKGAIKVNRKKLSQVSEKEVRDLEANIIEELQKKSSN